MCVKKVILNQTKSAPVVVHTHLAAREAAAAEAAAVAAGTGRARAGKHTRKRNLNPGTVAARERARSRSGMLERAGPGSCEQSRVSRWQWLHFSNELPDIGRRSALGWGARTGSREQSPCGKLSPCSSALGSPLQRWLKPGPARWLWPALGCSGARVGMGSQSWAPGTSVVQVTATDADDPTYGNSARVVYSILQGQPYFSVEPKTGVIKTALPNMDREAKDQYLLVIQAKDMVGQNGGLSGTTSVTVTLTDVNDNPPRFPRRSYQYNVPESLPVASVVARIKAIDADIGVNAEMEYKIVDGDGLEIFKITADKETQEGIITIQKELDFEAKTSYTLRIEAANRDADPRFLSLGPFSDTTTIKIIVEDVDEPPVFSSPLYPMEVSEGTQVGNIIGTVAAHDPDSSNSPVRYSIDRNTDLERYFNIDANSGVITTAKLLDRETNAVHNITVLAMENQNPSQVGRGYVAITILDINDNAPEFAMDYETTVCENAQPGQVIQKISAVDKDEPSDGHHFYFSLTTDTTNNHNFSLKDNKDNTASILTRRNGFRRQEQSVYYLPIFIVDSGSPSLSSTNTLTIRVCDCDADGVAQTCNAEAYVLPAGLSTGALIAILACVLTLFVLILLIVTMRRRKKESLIFDEERDIRENIVRYDDEGGGEEDTEAFDMMALRNLNVIRDSKTRRDVTPEIQFLSRPTLKSIPDNVIFREFIWERLKEADVDPGAPPYDSLQTYAFEGNGSIAESLSSLDSISSNSDQNYDYLSDWGPRFKRLADMYGNGQENLYS
ncbi:Cadherin-7 [Microtus ochrogaster]|uniref:Cadherin-7 n=1 Tax=Microtus ochrogaster TaxID=79684 RepID=A0A8J6KT84_MICOH|nr:Cadherin-7 [Microtus ochrogaster]